QPRSRTPRPSFRHPQGKATLSRAGLAVRLPRADLPPGEEEQQVRGRGRDVPAAGRWVAPDLHDVAVQDDDLSFLQLLRRDVLCESKTEALRSARCCW